MADQLLPEGMQPTETSRAARRPAILQAVGLAVLVLGFGLWSTVAALIVLGIGLILFGIAEEI